MANNVTPLISIGQLIDQSWETYREHFKPFMRIAMWFFLPALLYVISKTIAPSDTAIVDAINSGTPSTAEVWRAIIGGGISTLTSLIVMPLVGSWVFLALAKSLRAISHEKQKPLNEQAVHDAAKRDLLPYILQIGLLFLIGCLAIVPLAPGLGLIGINIFNRGGSVLGIFSIAIMILGTVASLILSFHITISLAFSGFFLTLEGKKPLEGIKASYDLVKGRFFPTLWRFVAPTLVFGVIPALIQFGSVIFLSLVAASLPNTNDAVLVNIVSLLGTVIVIGVNALMAPLPITANYFLYESLTRSRESAKS